MPISLLGRGARMVTSSSATAITAHMAPAVQSRARNVLRRETPFCRDIPKLSLKEQSDATNT